LTVQAVRDQLYAEFRTNHAAMLRPVPGIFVNTMVDMYRGKVRPQTIPYLIEGMQQYM
jgi:hypothetical protein